MDANSTLSIGLLFMVIGGCISVAGWLSNRESKVAVNAEWKGVINGKLDAILGLRNDVESIKDDISKLNEKAAVIEASAKSVHKRLDEHIRTHE